MNLTVAQGVAILLSSLLSIIFGLLPLKILFLLKHVQRRESISESFRKKSAFLVSASSCFTGGVFLGTSMLSMLPELRVHYACVKHLLPVGAKLSEYPWAEFVVVSGFFVVFFIEEVTLFVLKMRKADRPMEQETKEPMLQKKPNNGPSEQNHHHHHHHHHHHNSVDPLEPRFRPHPHSHLVRTLVLLLTLTFHTVIEAMGYGLIKTVSGVWTLFWTSSIHQVVVAFALGVQLARTHQRHAAFVICAVIAFALCTPIGYLLGLASTKAEHQALTQETMLMVLEGLAVGGFLYVTFFEVILHERNNEQNSFAKLIFISVGCASMAVVNTFHYKGIQNFDEIH